MSKPVRLARLALAVAVGAALLIYVIAGFLRVWSPLPLNDVEMGLVAHVRRLLHGQPIYGAPNVQFVALVYMPVFYYVSMVMARIMGDGFAAPRMVSFCASLTTIWLSYRIVWLETGSRRAGVVAAGFRAALGAEMGWVALARVDSLMGCLFLAAVYRLRVARGLAGMIAAGLLFGLAALTKQSALLMCVPVIAWQLWNDWRRAGVLTGALVATLLILGGFWEWQSGGWFSYYTIYLAAHQAGGSVLGTVQIASTDLMRLVPFAALVPVLLLIGSFRRTLEISGEAAAFYLAVTAGLFGATLTSEWLHGSLVNVLLLPCGWLLIVFTICGQRMVRVAERYGDDGWTLVAATIALAQFVALAYVPAKLLAVTDDPAHEGTRVVTIRGSSGRHGELRQWLHNSPVQDVEYADGFAVQDLLSGGTPEVTEQFERQVRTAICHATPQHPVVLDANVAARDVPGELSPVWACDGKPHQLE